MKKVLSSINRESGVELSFGINETKLNGEEVQRFYFKTIAGDGKETYFDFENKDDAANYIENARRMLEG